MNTTALQARHSEKLKTKIRYLVSQPYNWLPGEQCLEDAILYDSLLNSHSACLKIVAVFTIVDVTARQILPQNLVKSALEVLKRQKLEDKYEEQTLEQSDNENDDDTSNVHDLGKLLEVVIKSKYGSQKGTNRNEKTLYRKPSYQASLLDELNALDVNDVLVYDPDRYKSIQTERQQDNLLVTTDDDDNTPVYVVVKADDLQMNKVNNMYALISSLLQSSSGQKDRSEGRQDHRYKGFRVKDSYRRARDSGENYSSREVEEKRPLSRPRSYGSGRTPIPYIRHRGDIYEKDN